MLLVARAYFPSEDADTGSGLIWVFAVLATTAVGVASFLFSGGIRLRFSWADAAVIGLMFLVGNSATHAAERRVAITMAWEWGGLGLLYVLFRNLPRTRLESSALAGALVATAVAVAVYGLYQLPVEFPALQRMFLRNPDGVLMSMGITPGSPAAESLRNRLMGSNEVFSTFALANSLAGFLVGPLALAFAVALENLRTTAKGSRWVTLGLASVPGLILVVCVLLTKSRSAWVGLGVALLVLAWRYRRLVPGRILAAGALGFAVFLGGLIAVAARAGQLDREVITESTKSLRYRWEYWVGAWGVITGTPSPYALTGLGPVGLGPDPAATVRAERAFWSGVGPGNFAGHYLGQKLPQASEEILDPHNLVLEAWCTAGLLAAVALVLALGMGLRELLGPSRIEPETEEFASPPPPGARRVIDPSAPPARAGWLVAMAGLGWMAVWILGRLNPFAPDLLGRWLMLGLGWGLAVLLGGPLWKRLPIPAAGLGVGLLAISVNLLAAGGLGIPAVAMMLWALLAVGLNLRDDRHCGRLREVPGLFPAAALAAVWAALAGTFFGAVVPFWKSQAYLAEGNAYAASKPPAFEPAREAYERAIAADQYSASPWLALAELELRYWRSPEVQAKKRSTAWERVILAIDGALDDRKGRNPDNLYLRRRQADFARAILAGLPEQVKPVELLQLKTIVVRAFRNASRIYPTNAGLRAELAQSSADVGMFPDAIREARQALLLDDLMPHLDKKLPAPLRKYLIEQIPQWQARVDNPPALPAAKAK
jgi:hypothetical protein